MGCRKLTYHQEPAIGASWEIFISGKEKTASTPIFCIDYYTFGMVQPGRSSGLDESRHLFNGMEADGEVSGDGNSYTTQFRQYDPRLGRWKSLDPLMRKYPNMSPYVAFNNNPVYFVDPLGLEGEEGDGGGDPPKKGEKMPVQDYKGLGVEITAKQSSSSKGKAIVDRALGRGEFGQGGAFEGDYGSEDWNSFMNRIFGGSDGMFNLDQLQDHMTSNQKVNIYNEYVKDNDQTIAREESDSQWRDKVDGVMIEGKSKSLYYMGGFLVEFAESVDKYINEENEQPERIDAKGSDEVDNPFGLDGGTNPDVSPDWEVKPGSGQSESGGSGRKKTKFKPSMDKVDTTGIGNNIDSIIIYHMKPSSKGKSDSMVLYYPNDSISTSVY